MARRGRLATTAAAAAALAIGAAEPASAGVGHNGGPALEIEYERPWLYEKQRLAIFDPVDLNGVPARWAWIEASTKAGKTVGAMAWLFELALMTGLPGRNYWWVAPVYPQAKIAYRRLKLGLPKELYQANDQDLTITLPNGAVIWFKSAEKPDNLYGEDVWGAVVDEASRVRAESWIAVRSVLTATRGPCRCIGNVKGRKNWFYKGCRRAEAGAVGHAYAKLNAYDAVEAGVLAAEEIEDAKAQLPENVFRELYLAEASDDEGNPFGIRHIQACLAPMSDQPPVACGNDLAKSVDWSVVIGLDRDGVVCGFERWQSDWDDTERKILDLVGKCPTLSDSTGVGDPVVERMRKKRRNIEGFVFTSKSKQQLMEGLAVAIQQRLIRFPDGPIRAELDNFEYTYTRNGVLYSAPEGYHDDCVMALALAWRKYEQQRPNLRRLGPSGKTRISPFISSDTDDFVDVEAA